MFHERYITHVVLHVVEYNNFITLHVSEALCYATAILYCLALFVW